MLKQDTSIVPTLQATLRTSTNLLEKFHVMWTLEGLGALDAATVRAQMADREPRMRIQAIRASETLYKAGDKSFAADYNRLTANPSVDVVIQALLTINKWKVADAAATTRAVAGTNKARGVQLVATTIANPAANAGRGGPGGGGGAALSAERQRNREGRPGLRRAVLLVPWQRRAWRTETGDVRHDGAAACGSPRVNGHRDYVTKVVLYGLAGPIDGKTYAAIMIPNNAQSDEWVASVASYVRNRFGNSAGMVTAADVKRVRADVGDRRPPGRSRK